MYVVMVTKASPTANPARHLLVEGPSLHRPSTVNTMLIATHCLALVRANPQYFSPRNSSSVIVDLHCPSDEIRLFAGWYMYNYGWEWGKAKLIPRANRPPKTYPTRSGSNRFVVQKGRDFA